MQTTSFNLAFLTALFVLFAGRGERSLARFVLAGAYTIILALALEIVLGSSTFPPSQFLAVPDQSLLNDVREFRLVVR